MKILILTQFISLGSFFAFFNKTYALPNQHLSILAPTNHPSAHILASQPTRVEHYSHIQDLIFKMKQEPHRWDALICYEDEAKAMERSGAGLLFQDIYLLMPDPYVVFWRQENTEVKVNNWSELVDENHISLWRQKFSFVGPEKYLVLFGLLANPNKPENWILNFLKNKSLKQKMFPLDFLSRFTSVGISLLSHINTYNWVLKNISYHIPDDTTWYRQYVLAGFSSSKNKVGIKNLADAMTQSRHYKKTEIYLKPGSKWKNWPDSQNETWDFVDKTYKEVVNVPSP